MNTKRGIWIRRCVLMVALVLGAVVLISLALPPRDSCATCPARAASQEPQTVMARAQASTGDDVPLAGAGGWAETSVEIGDAPDDALVKSVQVKYHIVGAAPTDLAVQLLGSTGQVSHNLWNKGSAEGDMLAQSTGEITAFEGAPVNGKWSLAVVGGDSEGYIDDFSVVVSYETEMPVLRVDGPPGTPALLRLPEGVTPAGLSPDEADGSCGACEQGASVVPQHVPADATIIETEDFSSFPETDVGWSFYDISNDGYERLWDNAQCDPCGGDWGAWPADEGADGVYPCTPNNYPNNLYSWMIYGPFSLDSPDILDAGTEFTLWYETELDFDYVFFGVSTDGNNFLGTRWSGGNYSCPVINFGYPELIGERLVWVAWVFYSDGSINYDGAWVDDVTIWKLPIGPCPDPNCPEDLDCNGVIDRRDLRMVRRAMGATCPTR